MNFREYLKKLNEKTVVQIFQNGKENPEKEFTELLNKDNYGDWIVAAGKSWKKFDYNKALDVLIKKDKTGEQIFKASKSWKHFDSKKALDALKKISPDNYYKIAKKEWG
jgi:hypothetical protein